MSACEHPDFTANVTVNRMQDSGRFVAEVRVKCSACEQPFRFIGFEKVGVDWLEPCVNIDETMIALPIEPEAEKRLRTGARYAMPPELLGD